MRESLAKVDGVVGTLSGLNENVSAPASVTALRCFFPVRAVNEFGASKAWANKGARPRPCSMRLCRRTWRINQKDHSKQREPQQR